MPKVLSFWLNTIFLFVFSIVISLAIVVGEQNRESGYLWVKFTVLILLALTYAGWIFIKYFKSTLRNFFRYFLLMFFIGLIAVCIFSVTVVKLIGL